MTPRSRWLGAAAAALWLAGAAPAAAEAEGEGDACLDCHAELGEASMVLGDGEALPLAVDAEAWLGSAHAGAIGCADCHRGKTSYPHAEVEIASAQALREAMVLTCARCHYAQHTELGDSAHAAARAAADADAPDCIDCHGGHEVAPVQGTARTMLDARCATCHEERAAEYEQSVHGLARARGDADAPGCTGCHGSHEVEATDAAGFHAASYQMCARCHDDGAMMARHGLGEAIVSTYLDDFHGASNKLYAALDEQPERPSAACYDCHGAHDVQPFAAADAAALRREVAEVCRGCHEGVPDSFAGAWLSHKPPSLGSAPAVWAVTWGYRVLIPMILLGLVMHILLHLWKVRTHAVEE